MSSKLLFKREDFQTISDRMNEPRRFMQVVSGPRQVGKTTVVAQVMAESHRPFVFASADEPTLEGCRVHPFGLGGYPVRLRFRARVGRWQRRDAFGGVF